MLDFATLNDHDLQQAKYRNQGKVYSRNGTMGELAQARSNVKAINVLLRQRGLLVDAKAKLATKDATGLVAAAIAPLKDAAIAYAVEQATKYVAKVVAQFEGKDLNVVAPRPRSTMSRVEYKRVQSFRNAITNVLGMRAESNMPGAAILLVRSEKSEARLIANERDAAGISFDMYVAQLEGKVGQGVTAASVDGRHLWNGSVLTVTKGAVIERWHTQQIINYSVLGNAYNQWPTRLLKGGA